MISFLIPWQDSGNENRLVNFNYVWARLKTEWPNEQILTGGGKTDPLNRSILRNNLAGAAENDVLVFVDADSVVERNQLKIAIDSVQYTETWMLPYDRYLSLSEGGVLDFMAGRPNPGTLHVFPSDETPTPAVGGLVVVHRKAFKEVRGYDERFVGWGEEDRAFVCALRTLVAPEIRIPGPLYHIWHPAPESERFGQPNFNENRHLCNRYWEAEGKQAQMLALVAER